MSYIDNVRTFVRVYDLGSMSAAARDQRISPAVASSRMSQLENHLGVRLFQRTTRSLQPTEQGQIFYEGALRIIEAVAEAEAAISDVTDNPRGMLYIAAPLGIGRRFVAPMLPEFKAEYPLIDARLRLSDRRIDLTQEGLDVAFFLGTPEDSNLKMRKIADCERVLCANPDYIARRGMPDNGSDLIKDKHDCLNLRFPGAPEFQWLLQTENGPERFAITGPFETDDGDVLINWALDGQGIINKPLFEIAEHLHNGALVPVATQTPPLPVQLCCLYAHRRHQDPKTRLFIEYASSRMVKMMTDLLSPRD